MVLSISERSIGIKTLKEQGLVVEGSYPEVTQVHETEFPGNSQVIEVTPIVLFPSEPASKIKPITIFEPKNLFVADAPSNVDTIDEVRKN